MINNLLVDRSFIFLTTSKRMVSLKGLCDCGGDFSFLGLFDFNCCGDKSWVGFECWSHDFPLASPALESLLQLRRIRSSSSSLM